MARSENRRLKMDFQPVFMAGHSLQDFDKSYWKGKVRPRVVSATLPSCAVCGFVAAEKRGLIHADEVWSFPAPPKVKLMDVRPLCVFCHEAKDYAHLRELVRMGAKHKRRETQIKEHYCGTNGCSEKDFDKDFEIALAAKRELEESYNPNCRVEVDYGEWGRPREKPRLIGSERQLLKQVFEVCDEPFILEGRKFSNYCSAVRTLQSIPLDQRQLIFTKMRYMLEDDSDDDAIVERDEGVQFKPD